MNDAAGLALAREAGKTSDRVDVLVRLTDAVQVQGFNLRVRYDDSALELLEVSAGQGVSIFSDYLSGKDVEEGEVRSLPVALQVPGEPGEVLLADVLQPGTGLEGEADLIRLSFRLLDETVPGRVEIAEALVSDGMGRINPLPGVRLEELRALPTEYALSWNYPNPFNPVIRHQGSHCWR